MFAGGGFYLMLLVYEVWNQSYQKCRCNTDLLSDFDDSDFDDFEDSALNQKRYYSYIKFEQLVA